MTIIRMAKGYINLNSRLFLAMLVLLIFSPSSLSAAGDEQVDLPSGIKSKGVYFNVAQDRRIENIGGVYQPEGLDIYLKRNLDSLEEELGGVRSEIRWVREEIKGIQEAVSRIESALDLSQDNKKAKNP